MNENENIRIEFFSDAVFTVAAALPILDIKVSEFSKAAGENF